MYFVPFGLTKLNENNSLLFNINHSKKRKELVEFCVIPSLLTDIKMLLKINMRGELILIMKIEQWF